MFDANLINKVYEHLPERAEKARKKLQRPLTYTEKILYPYLYQTQTLNIFKHKQDYIDFSPARFVMQNGTKNTIYLTTHTMNSRLNGLKRVQH